MALILMVCTANICRSPLAQAILTKKLMGSRDTQNWVVESAGTWAMEGLPAARNARVATQQRGFNLEGHRSRSVSRELLRRFDLILTMEQNHREALLIEYPEIAGRVYLLSELAGPAYDVPDPYGGPIEAFHLTIDELDQLIERGLPAIIQHAKDAEQLRNQKSIKRFDNE
jgi:protein-tyrosine-phosphatase